MGLANYFRKFVNNFSVLAEPLTRKDVAFNWRDEQQNAFDLLKTKLCSREFLAIFDVKRNHEVHTDACSVGLAGVLFQQTDEGYKTSYIL